jgi:hypothetical protein
LAAASEGGTGAVQDLLKRRTLAQNAHSALQLAVGAMDNNAVLTLLSVGFDPTATDETGVSALDMVNMEGFDSPAIEMEVRILSGDKLSNCGTLSLLPSLLHLSFMHLTRLALYPTFFSVILDGDGGMEPAHLLQAQQGLCNLQVWGHVYVIICLLL